MDHADLPEAARDLIAAAELDAQSIFEARSAPQPQPVAAARKPPHGFNRWIVACIGSDRVADIRTPRMTYEFPVVFPQAVRARVLAERLRSEQMVGEKKGTIQDFAAAKELLIEFILRIFVAFAEEGCKIGIRGELTVQDLEAECLRFLSSRAHGAGLIDILAMPTKGEPEIPDDVMGRIERYDEWKKYKGLLEAVADAQAKNEPELQIEEQPAAGRDTPKPKRGAPTRIPVERKLAALAIKDAGGNYRDAAMKLYDTLYPTPQQVKNASKHVANLRECQPNAVPNKATPTE